MEFTKTELIRIIQALHIAIDTQECSIQSFQDPHTGKIHPYYQKDVRQMSGDIIAFKNILDKIKNFNRQQIIH